MSDALAESCVCPVCYRLMADPRTTACPAGGHTFCFACLERVALGSAPAACPTCRAPLAGKLPPANLWIRDAIAAMHPEEFKQRQAEEEEERGERERRRAERRLASRAEIRGDVPREVLAALEGEDERPRAPHRLVRSYAELRRTMQAEVAIDMEIAIDMAREAALRRERSGAGEGSGNEAGGASETNAPQTRPPPPPPLPPQRPSTNATGAAVGGQHRPDTLSAGRVVRRSSSRHPITADHLALARNEFGEGTTLVAWEDIEYAFNRQQGGQRQRQLRQMLDRAGMRHAQHAVVTHRGEPRCEQTRGVYVASRFNGDRQPWYGPRANCCDWELVLGATPRGGGGEFYYLASVPLAADTQASREEASRREARMVRL